MLRVGTNSVAEPIISLESCFAAVDIRPRSASLYCQIVVAGDLASGSAIAGRAVEAMRIPIVIGDAVANVRATVGGVWSARKDDLDLLISQADRLLYQAKLAGKDGWEVSAVPDVPSNARPRSF
ncbi:nucleotidyl cyclase domain-containing protein [Pararhizobium qamdonense]|uniref:hypothetical protein n=1 Tax=Pararhizobium qamdonense TaxID=3031126 RepID=UPI0023E09C24|nr:hypothetical protein [Pararhizobium qamdonense]